MLTTAAVFVQIAMNIGLAICTAWYFTILAGFYILYCPVMYLMFFNHKLYRKLVDFWFSLWELYPVGLFQWCCGTKLHHFGDHVDPNENILIVMNHRTRVDWNYVWLALYHASQMVVDGEQMNDANFNKKQMMFSLTGGQSKTKYVLKDELKNVPGLGWIMQLNFFLYVKRNWREDQIGLLQFIDYYKTFNYKCKTVIFPEGTDLSKDNLYKSEKFAISKKLPIYNFVLHPRSTGFAVLCSRMRDAGLTAVYDVTVAYDTPAQTEMDLLKGKMPLNAYFHFKRYNINEMPIEEDDLRKWLSDRWKEKEISLKNFHTNGTFLECTTGKAPIERAPRPLKTAKLGFIFWSFVDLLFIFGIFNSAVFQFWVIYHTLLFVFVTWNFGGFHNIQYKLVECR